MGAEVKVEGSSSDIEPRGMVTVTGQRLHERDEDTGVGRRTRARGEHGGDRLQGQHVGDAERVVPIDDGLRAQLAKVLDEVVGEGVVVVEDEEHGENLNCGGQRH